MFEILSTLTMSSIVTITASALSLLAFTFSIVNNRSLKKQHTKQLKVNRRLLDDNRALSQSAVGMGQKVLETERRINQVLKKQFAILNAQPDHPSYDQATRLIAMGASEDDLVNSCGFSHAEAELLLSLNKGSGAAVH